MSRIAVIGGGAWGTALAAVAARRGDHQVRLWALEKEVCESIAHKHINSMFLPDCKLPESLAVTNDFREALEGAEIVVSVMPSHHCRRSFEHMAQWLRPEMLFVSATKGIENDTLLRMSEVIREVVDRYCHFTPRIAVLSGPSFAREVAEGKPTAVTVAAPDIALAARVQKDFTDPRFRIYVNDDVIGVELGGSLKNVIAIAAGICAGMQTGHNSVAALITRGLVEITRLAVACGAEPQTMAGLAGMGDLVLTCTGGLSRNRSVGAALGEGKKLSEIIAGMHGMVAEGVLTTNAAMGLAKKHAVEMPITEQMHAILHEDKSPHDVVRELMTRPGKAEERF
ncbi:MAG TPA: NAD(P)H-dependent glycerol-3-phosphate dehydrogenase [Candidatus Limnocylindrales bacterium]|jgi:glycerol-3-phosphate dehydrogenase (NAD(P)+)|nr:NAD(P)H-dependent glycerol-3-phosphate dehydrogenase [Candidatus Limnocylindrales bacterium]